MGRPSKYKPDYCEQLIQHMTQGLSFDSFAGKINVNQDTLHEWAKKHKQFADAKKMARAKSRLYWETVMLNAMHGKIANFNTTVWVFAMKNMHGWRDRVEIMDDEEPEDMEFIE